MEHNEANKRTNLISKMVGQIEITMSSSNNKLNLRIVTPSNEEIHPGRKRSSDGGERVQRGIIDWMSDF